MQLFTSVGVESLIGSHEWFSQVLAPSNFGVHAMGQAGLNSKGARMNWLLSTQKTGKDPLPELIDHMGYEAGIRGAKFITAGVMVEDCLFETLRRSGYCVYGWESIWKIHVEDNPQTEETSFQWRESSYKDILTLENLQRKLLSPAVQSVTEFAKAKLPDYILQDGEDVLGYVYCKRLNTNALIKPYLRRDISHPADAIKQLIRQHFDYTKSMLLVQTSDQSWMTETLFTLGKQIHPREELMVKHFAVMEKHTVAALNKVQNGRQTDTVRPLMPSTQNGENLSKQV